MDGIRVEEFQAGNILLKVNSKSADYARFFSKAAGVLRLKPMAGVFYASNRAG
jgi:hypothetical protein